MYQISVFSTKFTSDLNMLTSRHFAVAKREANSGFPTFALAVVGNGFPQFTLTNMPLSFLRETVEAAIRAIGKIDWEVEIKGINYRFDPFDGCCVEDFERRIWILASWEKGFNDELSSEEDDFDTLMEKIEEWKSSIRSREEKNES